MPGFCRHGFSSSEAVDADADADGAAVAKPRCEPASDFGIEDDDEGCKEVGVVSTPVRPGTNRYPWQDLQWREIGSGAWARTFVGLTRLLTTTRRGPCHEDILRRVVRDAVTGAVIDDCMVDDCTDKELFRHLDRPRDVIIEVTMRNAAKWFRQKGADVAEVYSPPRVVREAGLRLYGGKRLRPGWSLDLTTVDPETGQPWDLSNGKTRSKVVDLIREGKPYCFILSPMCTAFSAIQNINKERRDKKVIAR